MDCNTPNHGTKVPFDPGWNDPPKLAYNAQQATPNRPRNFLNKRVAFPLSGSNTGPVASPPTNFPPMPAAPVIPTPSVESSSPYVTKGNYVNIDSESALQEVKNILLKFLEDSSELGPKANDIRKRISVMEELWSNGKLDKGIHAQMKELAYAIKNNEPLKADNIHRALMVEHVSAVGSWMPGVKQLIHYCIAKSELLSIDQVEE